jgi:hypothetical protein
VQWGASEEMKDQTVSLFRLISFLIEIVFGLLLLVNGVLLIVNYSGLFPFQQKFLDFLSVDSLFRKSIYEWRFFIEFLHASVASHLSAVVMICMGIAIVGAALHFKKSL